ncbi:MAG: hypothetical protein BJ554DRAFT_8402, partial [Olpidium bornovanus]
INPRRAGVLPAWPPAGCRTFAPTGPRRVSGRSPDAPQSAVHHKLLNGCSGHSIIPSFLGPTHRLPLMYRSTSMPSVRPQYFPFYLDVSARSQYPSLDLEALRSIPMLFARLRYPPLELDVPPAFLIVWAPNRGGPLYVKLLVPPLFE